MNIDDIRKNAPPGATHYFDNNGKICYFINTKIFNYFWNFDEWRITYRDILDFAKPL